MTDIPHEDAEEDEETSTYVSITSYSALGANPADFRTLIRRLSEDLPTIIQMTGAEAVAVRGTSGYSVAFAMRMVSDIPFIVARKHGENSHGPQLAMFNDGRGADISRYIVLDDLVCTGKTFFLLTEDLAPAVCVGLVEYGNLMSYIQDGEQQHCHLLSVGRTDACFGDEVETFRYKKR